MFKKFASFSLAFVLFFAPLQALAFTDTQDKAVNFLRTQQVFDKAEKFYPNLLARRAEFVMWTLRNREIFFQENDVVLEPFQDVLRGQKEAPYVGLAWRSGVLKTTENFRPYRAITRLEALKIILAVEGIPTPLMGFELPEYTDLPSDPQSRAIIAKALNMRIIAPVSATEFGTNAQLTRLEAAWLIYNVDLSSASDQLIFQSLNPETKKEKEEIFDYIWDILHNRSVYADEIVDADLMSEAIKGMVDSFDDPYTVYFPRRDDTDSFLQPLNGSLQGIGAQVAQDPETNEIYIVSPLKNSPAEDAGLKSGDVVLKIDDLETKGMTLEESISHIKGEVNTEVILTVQRGTQTLQIPIIRAEIVLSSVNYEIKDNYLIFNIDYFGTYTISEFKKIVDQHYNKAIKGVVIDLRGNPGGYLSTAVELLEFFFPNEGEPGVIVKRADSMQYLEMERDGELKNASLAVLIDPYSASASEIFAGAIQDYKRGIIVGQTSFGKGTVQELTQFPDGSSLKVTIAEWKTPIGRSINKLGINPDIEVENNDDTVVDVAIRELKKGKGRP